jgi:predicted ATPase/class 3 adenylate cyclase
VSDLPTGTVTFLFTDLEGSTRLWEDRPDDMRVALARHDEILRKNVETHEGAIVKTTGDGLHAAFATADHALAAAVDAQLALTGEVWPLPQPLRVRMGIHTGAAEEREGDYYGPAVNRAARVAAAAHGGQILVSHATEELGRDTLPPGAVLLDLGEHRLRDLGRPTRVFQLVREGANEEFPPLRSLDAFPGNLPVQVSSFIGRKSEVARVVSALDESRVVTITGVGGVGKTRSALQIAGEVLPRYRDGTWLVELAAVRDPEAVVEAIAAVFGLTIRGGPSLEDSLIEMLAEKQLLLVLDNCEHLLGPLARLVTRIERICSGVVVLATSREGMAIDGEQLIALPPLATGDPEAELERLMDTEAVSLFVERARHVKADFMLTHGNARAVVEICQRLDGVPLAIELAAARVIALNPVELLQRLDRRFQVLAGGRRGAVERHATLRAAIDWSYELLDTSEKHLLARMAVFTGGCALEAIEEVCSGGPVERQAVIDLVAGLVARSLVVAEDDGRGTRYRLLETIRQYGEERLAEWDEADALLIRHGRYYGALSALAAERFYGPEQIVWARQVNRERDNIRAALGNAIDGGDAALAVQLVADQLHQQVTASPIGEVLWIPASRVLDLPRADQEPGYPRVLVTAAYNAYTTGDSDAIDELCLQALEAEREFSRPRRGPGVEADVLHARAMVSLSAGAYADAVSGFARAAELANADGYPGLAATYLSYSVNSALLGGNWTQEITARAEEAVALARQSGMPVAIVMSLNSSALALAEKDPQRARALLHESFQLSGRRGEEISSGLLTACLVAGRLRDWELTLTLTARTMYLWRWYVSPLVAAPCLALCARAFAEIRPDVAGVLQGAAFAVFRYASRIPEDTPARAQADTEANFVLAALRETGGLVAAALGEKRARELRNEGAAMNMDEATSYALANIDRKLLTGPITD